MAILTENELLRYAVDNGIINIDTIRQNFEMNKRQEYLAMHKSKVWNSTDGKWYTFVPDIRKPKGKRLIKRSTKEKLDDFLVEFYKEYEEPQTIEKTYREWIAWKFKLEFISIQTIQRYDQDFERFFSEYKKVDIRYVPTDFLDDFIVSCIKKYHLKPKAWSNLRTIIRGIFLFAKKKGYTNVDIIQYLDELELPSKIFSHEKKPEENIIFNEDEISALIGEIGKSRKLSDLSIMFAIYTGMRVGEIVALKWEDINESYIHVNRTQIRYKGDNGKYIHKIRDFPKIEAGIRDIMIVPELKKVIRKLRCINPFTEYVFETKKGDCVHKHSVCARLYYLCDQLSIPRKGMHSIRRYYATELINAGVEESIIISLMGHTKFETTKGYYYLNNKSQEYIAEMIENALQPKPAIEV